jgi:hypothetical protein
MKNTSQLPAGGNGSCFFRIKGGWNFLKLFTGNVINFIFSVPSANSWYLSGEV